MLFASIHTASTPVPLGFKNLMGLMTNKFPLALAGSQSVETVGLQLLGHVQSAAVTAAEPLALHLYGEIYNRKEIASLSGIATNENLSDADLVKALIVARGLAAAKFINGQFVIIYVEDDYIHIINDHLGVQQLLYYQQDGLMLLGSEVKFLMTHPQCPKGIDWAAALQRPIPEILLSGSVSYSTWFKGINLLPEANILSFQLSTGKSHIRPYWQIQDTKPATNDNRTVAEVMDGYIALLEDAIKIRMAADGSTDALLSGGMDSSAICALAARNGKIDTYSIVSPTTVLEETTTFCDSMAKEIGFGNSQFLVPYRELCFNHHLWKQQLWRAESPINHTDALSKTLLHLSIKANKPTATHVLSGTGSDQLNGGLVGYIARPGDDAANSWDNFYNEILDAEYRKLIGRNQDSVWLKRKFIHRDYLGSIKDKPIAENPWTLYMEGALHSQAFSLLWDENRASESHGHTTRYPFMDYRLAEFIAAVPVHLHPHLFYDKQILRVPAKQFLPEYIVNKPKMPYNLPEHDFRVELCEFLTADNENSLFTAAFGDLETPHPVINKKYIYSRIQALRQKPEIVEWQNIMHLINLGLLDQIGDKTEADLNYEAVLGVPEKIDFTDAKAAIASLEKRLDIITIDRMLDRPLRFGEDCSLLFDTKSKRYYVSKRNNLTYQIEEEYKDWFHFLETIDNQLSARQILAQLGIEYKVIAEFFNLCLKEQILVITDIKTGY